MKINATSYDPYLAAIAQSQLETPEQQVNVDVDVPDMDSYIPTQRPDDMPIPTGTYNASGMMVGELPDLPPIEATNTDSQTNTSSEFMDALSQAFRANEDSIQMTMDSLGLTVEDLADEENMTALAAAMNEGAANLGLPQIEDLEGTVDSLMEVISGVDSTASATDETASEGQSAASDSSSSEAEVETQIVTIDGVTYLETTTTENGITTVERTEISSVESV
ncbi:MAG: hypothetical protein K6G01_02030 [Eubacterium sp.]|nr:hypothetical protein [Eubacterium sp.]